MNISNKKQNELLQYLKMEKLFGMNYFEEYKFLNRNMINNNLPTDFKSLEEYILNCSLCKLSKTKGKIPYDRGNWSNSIYLVGLNTHFNNMKYELFTTMIEDVLNISINDIYMTNILKCNHSNYHKNYDLEVEKCIPFFEKQIDINSPRIILALGNAFSYIMNSNENIIEISGNKFKYKNTIIVPLLEYDFVHKNPSFKDKMFQDLKKIKNILD